MSEQKDLAYYLKLPYEMVVTPDPTGGYVARIPDLPGCMTQGSTIQELLENLEDAKRTWLEDALASGEEITEPAREFSGRVLVRMPRSLHREIAQRARQERVSLNQFIVYHLARALGYEAAVSARSVHLLR